MDGLVMLNAPGNLRGRLAYSDAMTSLRRFFELGRGCDVLMMAVIYYELFGDVE